IRYRNVTGVQTCALPILHRLRTDVFTHLQRMPLDFFSRTRGGEVQSRLTNDINGMQSVVTNSATSIASNVTTVIGTAVALLALSWRLILLSLIVLPPAIFLTRRVAQMRRRVASRAQRSLADLQTQIEESLSISGVHLSKTLASGERLSGRFAATSAELRELEVQSQVAGRWRMATLSIIFSVIPALIYLIAGLPATSGGMTIGTLVAFAGLQSQLFRPLMGVLNVGVQITTSKALFPHLRIPRPARHPHRAGAAHADPQRRWSPGDRYRLLHLPRGAPPGPRRHQHRRAGRFHPRDRRGDGFREIHAREPPVPARRSRFRGAADRRGRPAGPEVRGRRGTRRGGQPGYVPAACFDRGESALRPPRGDRP